MTQQQICEDIEINRIEPNFKDISSNWRRIQYRNIWLVSLSNFIDTRYSNGESWRLLYTANGPKDISG